MFDLSFFNFRDLKYEDKQKVLGWRNQERIRENMYTDHIITEEEHDNWISQVLKDKSEKNYVIAEYQNQPVGLVSFTNINRKNGICYWGFYLGDTSSPRGSGFVIEFMALEYAFERLSIRKIYCEIFAFNKAVIKQHTRFGFEQEGILKKHALKRDNYEDVVLMAMFRDQWLSRKEYIQRNYFSI